MRALGAIAFVGLGLILACKQPAREQPPKAEVRQIAGNTFQIVPQLDQESAFKYCLIFTRSQNGVVRQLTMTHENMSVPCRNEEPVANVRFRAPVNEGGVKVHVFFSDQKLNAGSIAQQLYERKGDPSFSPLDLRLPGNVIVHTSDFVPTGEAEAPTVGMMIGEDGGTAQPGTAAEAADAGTVGAPVGAADAG